VNKNYAGALVYVALVLFAIVLIANYSSATRDVSWIDEVENFIQKENWEPDREYVPLMDWAFFLHENGTEQYFYLESQSEFISHINSVMNRIDRRVEESISDELLDEILATDKVLAVVHRFSTKSGMWTAPNNFGSKVNYDRVYFVLEEKLGTGLEGAIIVREHNFGDSYYKYSLWQISCMHRLLSLLFCQVHL
jgi:hypothetical protein